MQKPSAFVSKFFVTLLVLLPMIAGAQGSRGFENPIRYGSITELLVALLNVVVILLFPIVVFFIILAGFKYVTARGDANQVGEASQALLYGVIGAVILLGATAIVQIVKNLVNNF